MNISCAFKIILACLSARLSDGKVHPSKPHGSCVSLKQPSASLHRIRQLPNLQISEWSACLCMHCLGLSIQPRHCMRSRARWFFLRVLWPPKRKAPMMTYKRPLKKSVSRSLNALMIRSGSQSLTSRHSCRRSIASFSSGDDVFRERLCRASWYAAIILGKVLVLAFTIKEVVGDLIACARIERIETLSRRW